MPRYRLFTLGVLFLAPVLFLLGMGSYHLWTTGWGFIAWWPMMASFGVGYLLAWRWTRGRAILPPTDGPGPNYWTDQDRAAWAVVDAKAQSFQAVTGDQLSDPQHYANLAIDLAQQVGRAYNPKSDDPFGGLTLPEVLACVELAAADLNGLVRKYVPGSHLLRMKDIRRAKQAADWYAHGRNLYWLGAVVLNPMKAPFQYAASRFGLGTMMDKLQGNVFLWFHTAFVHEFGRYLIELNSGRLRVGVTRYREIIAEHQEPPAAADRVDEPAAPATPPPAEPAPAADTPAAPPPAQVLKPITVALLGQVKAGKSSLVNAMLGERRAAVDVLPISHVGTRYALTLNSTQPLTLIDTRGYGQDGPGEEEFSAAAAAAQDADLVLLVTPARTAARKGDVELLDKLRAWFADRPRLKLPPVVAVANQIDLLSPAAEWKPPYDWRAGTRPKEASIRDCLDAAREQFGDRVADIVPVCAREGDVFGLKDGLLPAVVEHLDAARGAAVLRAFQAEADAARWQRLKSQAVEGGKQALKILWDNLNKK